MRITPCGQQFVVTLEAQEASLLMDACAMVVMAAESVPEARLPADMAAMLGELFQGLRSGTDQPQEHPREPSR
jgi:hypothetical protein